MHIESAWRPVRTVRKERKPHQRHLRGSATILYCIIEGNEEMVVPSSSLFTFWEQALTLSLSDDEWWMSNAFCSLLDQCWENRGNRRVLLTPFSQLQHISRAHAPAGFGASRNFHVCAICKSSNQETEIYSNSTYNSELIKMQSKRENVDVSTFYLDRLCICEPREKLLSISAAARRWRDQ